MELLAKEPHPHSAALVNKIKKSFQISRSQCKCFSQRHYILEIQCYSFIFSTTKDPLHRLGDAKLLHDPDMFRGFTDEGKSILVFRFKDDGGKKVFDGDGKILWKF